jgi:glycine oxidase
MSKRLLNIVIVGAGVVGSCLALELARRGARVTVMDPELGSDSASAIAAGMIAPILESWFDPVSRPHLELLMAGRDAWEPLVAAGIVEMERSNSRARGTGGEQAALEAYLTEHRREFQTQGSELLIHDDWILDAQESLKRLQLAAQAAGAVFVADRFEGFEGGMVAGANSGRLACDRLIWAGGVAPHPVLPELACLVPIKGHILEFPGESSALRGVVRGPQGYICSLAGRQLGGATMEIGNGTKEIDTDQVSSLRLRLMELDPDLAGQDFVARTGVRAATPDGLPLVGYSRQDTALVATGMRRNGWLLAPLVAGMIADLCLDRDPGLLAGPMQAQRFL